MNSAEFEAKLHEQGYPEVVDRRMDENATNPEHTHEFDARLLVLEGEMTVTSEGKAHIYRAGDTFAISARSPHTEQSGPKGARYLAGRRYQKEAVS